MQVQEASHKLQSWGSQPQCFIFHIMCLHVQIHKHFEVKTVSSKLGNVSVVIHHLYIYTQLLFHTEILYFLVTGNDGQPGLKLGISSCSTSQLVLPNDWKKLRYDFTYEDEICWEPRPEFSLQNRKTPVIVRI